MSDTPRTLTLRQVAWDELKPGDCTVNNVYYPSAFDSDGGPFYRMINPIPEGYETCDLADATKVLIGETWFEKAGIIIQRAGSPHYFTEEALEPLGVLAIRPIPETEPEPMNGEITIGPEARYGAFPESLVGKRVRWEVIE